MDKVSALQPRDRGFESHTVHDHDSSYDNSRVYIRYENLFQNRANDF